MGKITRQQLKLHEQAEGLLWGSDKKLTQDQVAFCLEHWDPRALAGKQVARLGITMILPQNQTPFRYSGAPPGCNVYTDNHTGYLKRFLAGRPTLEWHHSSLDTTHPGYQAGWRGAAPLVEVVTLRDQEAALLPLADAPVEMSPDAAPPAISRPVCALALAS
jgi:hypothetical protein